MLCLFIVSKPNKNAITWFVIFNTIYNYTVLLIKPYAYGINDCEKVQHKIQMSISLPLLEMNLL